MSKKKSYIQIATSETQAMEFYAAQKRQMSDALRKKINKKTITGHVGFGLAKGIIVGGILGFLFSQVNRANLTEVGKAKYTSQSKSDDNRMKHSTLYIIAIMTLLSLVESGIFTIKECRENGERANKLANDTFKEYFKLSLSEYANGSNTPFRSTRAAALIINNMPEHELQQLHNLAIRGLVEADDVFIRNSAIADATILIADFLKCNPTLNKLVGQIMNGEEVKTYIVGKTMQNQR